MMLDLSVDAPDYKFEVSVHKCNLACLGHSGARQYGAQGRRDYRGTDDGRVDPRTDMCGQRREREREREREKKRGAFI